MNRQDRFTALFHKYCNNSLTPSELLEWSVLIQDEAQLSRLTELIDELFEHPIGEKAIPADWQALSCRLGPVPSGKVKRYPFWLKMAASILLTLSISIGIYRLVVSSLADGARTSVAQHDHVIRPATRQAVIKVEGYADMPLDSSGLLVVRNGRLYNNGKLIAQLQNSLEQAIQVPRGGHYQIDLPDGTHVHLNANSTLRFPGTFADSARHVYLQGEAYFDVVHRDDHAPFFVHTADQDVKVLGTQFNVAAYQQRTSCISLFKGKVQVSFEQQQVLLSPGEQTVLNQRQLHKQKADLERVGAWKENRFIFNETPFEDIAQDIAAWYDVDFIFSPATMYLKRKKFSGSLSRSSDIQDVLKLFQETGSVDFKIQERRIVVMPR